MIEKIGSSQEMSITLATPPLIAPQHHHLGADGYCSLASASASTKMKKFIKYMECLKNHAAAIGGSATDGCGEFMAGGEAGSLESLKCEACNCHRNFHRKIIHMQQPQPEQGGGGGVVKSNISGEGRSKRLRSKFSQEQKEKMQRFAEKAGWKIPKADDAELRSFCQEIGVNRKVLKVWMHNNKYNHLPATC